MKTYNFMFLIVACLSVFSCGPDNFSSEYAEATKDTKDVGRLRDRLIDLDQRYPDRFLVKTDLAVIALSNGQLEEAGAYLKKAKGLVKQATNDKERQYLFWSAYADWAVKAGQHDLAIEGADAAMSLSYPDKLGTVFVKARALAAKEKKPEALAVYRASWNGSRETMSREDLFLSIQLLIEDGDTGAALERLAYYQERYGFEPGVGILQSAVYERQGKVNESLLAAFLELELAKNLGQLKRAGMVERVAEVKRKLAAPEWPLAERGESCFIVLEAYMRDDYAASLKGLERLDTDKDQSAYRYLLLASRLRTSRPTVGDIDDFIKLEPVFRADPGYYFILWNAMKSGPGVYTLDTARFALEKTILLGPSLGSAALSRVELGRLMGLGAAESAYLLLGPELDDIYSRYLSSGEVSVLVPAVKALAIQNNVYTSASEAMLKNLVRIDKVRMLLEEVRSEAKGVLALRLDNILAYR